METHRRSTSSAPPTAARDLHKRLVENRIRTLVFPQPDFPYLPPWVRGTPGKLPEFPFPSRDVANLIEALPAMPHRDLQLIMNHWIVS